MGGWWRDSRAEEIHERGVLPSRVMEGNVEEGNRGWKRLLQGLVREIKEIKGRECC